MTHSSPTPTSYSWRHGVCVLVGFEAAGTWAREAAGHAAGEAAGHAAGTWAGDATGPAAAGPPSAHGAMQVREGADADAAPAWMSWDARLRAMVAPGHRFPDLRRWAEARGVPEATEEDGAGEPPPAFHDARVPRPYQAEALTRWRAQGHRGTVVLPTGAGKTLVALLAIREQVEQGRGAVVVVPTRALVGQWFSQLADAFGHDAVGAWYGDEKEVRRITVTTYHSSFALLERYGRNFELVVLDEAHHLADAAPGRSSAGRGSAGRGSADPGSADRGSADRGSAGRGSADPGSAGPGSAEEGGTPGSTSWHDALLVAPAPARLGLTATYPDGRDRALVELVGPVAYRRRLGEMLDAELSDLALERRYVGLLPRERERYDAATARYERFVEASGYAERFGPRSSAWWPIFMADTRRDPEARRAHRAFRDRERIVALAEEKMAVMHRILGLHPAEQAIVFCGTSEAAEAVSLRFAIPLVQAATPASERKRILDRMASGEIRAVAAVEVLDEGWDVPGAKLGIILGGSRSGGPRQHQQRLGRILRRQGDRVASLYELVAADTHEFFQARRREGVLRRATDRQLGLGL